jgi:hypothetical protein
MNHADHIGSMRALLLMLVLLLAGCRPGVESDEHAPNHYPEFSWDRLPLYTHVRKVAAFTPEELNYLATFPLITFEKTTGAHTYGSTDAGTIAAAKAVKAINPKSRILFYRNVFVHYGGYSFDQELEGIDAWFIRDQWGRGKFVRERAEAYDLTNPDLTDWWVRTAAGGCADDAIDGLFLDGNIKVLSHYRRGAFQPGQKEAIAAAYHDMMKETRAALPEGKLMLANIIRAMLPDSGMKALEHFDGSYLEGFTLPVGDTGSADYIVKGIEAVQTAARQGKIIAMTLGLGESAADEDKVDDSRAKLDGLSGLQKRINYYIALFLVCAEKYSYLNLHDGYCVDTRNGRCMSKVWLKRFPEYDRPLGPPKGPAKRDGYVFTREFEHVSVRVDVESQVGEVVWGE